MPDIFQFGEFELDRGAYELRRGGKVVKLERIPLDLLFLFAEKQGQLVTRDEILDRIWGKNVFIDTENSVNTAVRKIRLALNENGSNVGFVQTVSGKGYRFIGSRQKKVMLGVLPFVNIGGDARQEAFADGMTEELTTRLGSLSPIGLGVIARSSAVQYKNRSKNAAQIAAELGVDYLLEGSVRLQAEKVRVSVQLIAGQDQTQRWAGTYNRELIDVLPLQSEIACAAAEQIHLTLSERIGAQRATSPRLSPQAHEAYLEGLQDWNRRTGESFTRAIENFRRATVLDPNYAMAHAALARVYALAPIFGVSRPRDTMPEALAAAERAIGLDDSIAEAHSVLGFVKSHYEYDWSAAEREFRRAIELNPSNAYAHFFYSNSFLSPQGRHEQAIAEMKAAIELDPVGATFQSFLGRTYDWAGRVNDALEQFQRCARVHPNFAVNRQRLAQLYARLGQYEDAFSEETKARIFSGQDPDEALTRERQLRSRIEQEGSRGYWSKLLEEVDDYFHAPEDLISPFGRAIIFCHLADNERAVSALEHAHLDRDLRMTEAGVEPAFQLLRSDSRFRKLLTAMNLKAQQR